MAGSVENIVLPIEGFALAFNVIAILLAATGIAVILYKLAGRSSTHLFSLLALTVLALFVQCARYFVSYIDGQYGAVIILDFLVCITSLVFVLLDVNLLNTFVLTGHLSVHVVNGLRALAVVAHVAFATPIYLNYIAFDDDTVNWASLWYRYTSALWFGYIIIYDFSQSIWITHTVWVQLKQTQRVLLKRIQVNVNTGYSNSDAGTATMQDSDQHDNEYQNDLEADGSHGSYASTNATAIVAVTDTVTETPPPTDPHKILRRRYYYSIACIILFFTIDTISVVLFEIASSIKPSTPDSRRTSIALRQIATVSITIHFIGAAIYFENLRSMMVAKKQIVLSSNSSRTKRHQRDKKP